MIQGNDYSFIVLVNHMVKCFFCLFVCFFFLCLFQKGNRYGTMVVRHT